MQSRRRSAAWLPALAALGLFAIWSNTFIAISYLLGREAATARFDWRALTVARFLPVLVVCSWTCFVHRRSASLAIVRAHWRRLAICGLLAVPAYNFTLYYGQQHGVPAPVASLTTALAPIFILLLSIGALGERLTWRRSAGFLLCLAGIVTLSLAKPSGGRAYPLLVSITALAPLSWSLFSIVTKPVAGRVPPVLWTYLVLIFGTTPLLLLAPWSGGPELLRLDAVGWGALLYLSLLATVLGFAIWTWLLKHLPASTVGLTVFLNPPLTTSSKALLSHFFPASFSFSIVPLEWVGGGIVLAGMALAILRPSRAAAAATRR